MGYNIPAVCFSEVSASVLIILLFLCRSRVGFGSQPARKLFSFILLLATICPLVELCSYLVLNFSGHGYVVMSWILSILSYVFLATDAVLWAAYSNIRAHNSREHLMQKKLLLIPYIVDVVLIVTSPLTKLVFVITPENIYIRGSFMWITYLVALFYVFLATYTSVKVILKNLEFRIFPFIYFTVLALVGVILQLVFPSMAFMWIGINMGLVMVHIQWQNELTFRDAMTGMLNRRGLFDTLARIKRQNRDYCGIMCDIDYFKQINDTYGHAEGDRAIHAVANIIADAADGKWILIRFGGDEFIALKPTTGEDDAGGLKLAIERRLDILNKGEIFPFDITMSIGNAIIKADEKDTDKFLRNLDESMYQQKGLRHASLRRS